MPIQLPEGYAPLDDWDAPVGKYLGERWVEVNPEVVSAFASGAADVHPWYSQASPFGGPIAPALIGGQEPWRFGGWYPEDVRGNLHFRQGWDLYAPVMVGSRYRSQAWVSDRYRRRDRHVIVLEVLLSDADGCPLARGRTDQSFLLEQPDGEVVSRERERDPIRRPTARQDDGHAPIEVIEGEWQELTPELCLAAADGVESYHTDRELARAMGFPAVVVQGVFNANRVSALMTGRFGAGWFCGGRLQMAFVNIIWGGDVVRPVIGILDQVPEGPRTRVHCEVRVEKRDGTVTGIGSASAVIAAGPIAEPGVS